MAQKLKNNKKLTPRDQQTIKRLEEAKNDLKLPPELRTSWLFDFEETYELFGGNEGDELHTSVNACLEKKITSNRSDVGPVPVHVLSSPKVPDVVSVVVSSASSKNDGKYVIMGGRDDGSEGYDDGDLIQVKPQHLRSNSNDSDFKSYDEHPSKRYKRDDPNGPVEIKISLDPVKLKNAICTDDVKVESSENTEDEEFYDYVDDPDLKEECKKSAKKFLGHKRASVNQRVQVKNVIINLTINL